MGSVAVAHAFGLNGGPNGMAPRKGLLEGVRGLQRDLFDLHRIFLSEPFFARGLEGSEEDKQPEQRSPKRSTLPEAAEFREAWKGDRPLHGGSKIANFPKARPARLEKRM